MNDEPPCDCPNAGWCERFQMHQTAHAHRVCQSNSSAGNAYRKKWRLKMSGEKELPKLRPKPSASVKATTRPKAPIRVGGPGTELKKLLASIGLTAGGCKCNARVRDMDAWGVEGCQKRFDEIVAWIRQERDKRGWVEKLKATGKAITTGLAFRLDDVADPLPSLVREAIRLASHDPEPSPVTPAETAPVSLPLFVPGKRHLLYHLLPVSENGTWQRNLDQLKMRWRLFSGRKVIAICTPTRKDKLTLDPPDLIREYMRDTDCEFLEIANSQKLREVATWRPLWSRLEEFANTDDVVLYAHAKGVTRPFDTGTTVHHWTRMLYSSLLDFWPLVEELLGKHPIVGTFKKVGKGFKGSKSRWHYSGSFFWARTREVFRHRRFDAIDPLWWGNEAWPGLHFSPSEAGCVFMDGQVPSLDIYSWQFATETVLPKFLEWCKQNSGQRTVLS